MSAAAIQSAPSPTPGAAPTGASKGGHAAHAAQQGSSSGAQTAFEAMVASLFGVEAATDGDVAGAAGASALGGKTAADAKTATDSGKAKGKTAGQAADATADANTAGATPDPSLLAIVPSPTLSTITAQIAVAGGAPAGAGAAQPPAAGVTDKSAGATGADALAQLAGAAVDADAGKTHIGLTSTVPTTAGSEATAVAAAATDAAASAKIDSKLTPTPTPTADAAPQAPATPSPTPAPQPGPQGAADIPAPQAQAATLAAADTAAVTPSIPALEATTAPPVASVAGKTAGVSDRVQGFKTSTRVDLTKIDTTPGASAGLTGKAPDLLQAAGDAAPRGALEDETAQEPLLDAKTDVADAAPPQADAGATAATTANPATLVQAAAVAVRGAPQTVANLASQIVKKLDGRTSQFDVQLDPAGLGKVDVRIAIGADGRMSAAMSFDTPQAAAELKARAGELQQALEQSGFNLAGGMSFDVASDRGQGGQAQNQQPDAGAAFRGRAFQAALDTTADAAPQSQLLLRRNTPSGVDIRI